MFGTKEMLIFGTILVALVLLYVLVIVSLYRLLMRLGGNDKIPPSLIWLALVPGFGAPVGAFFTGWFIWRLHAFCAEKLMRDSLIPLIVYAALTWLAVGLSFLTRSPAVAAFTLFGLVSLLATLASWARKIKTASAASFQ
jgi:hypothetical protein